MHACALLEDKSIACWGYGGYGELGLGTSVDTAPEPRTVPGLGPAVSVSSCDLHSCAALQDGTVSCWGNDTAYTPGTFSPATVAGVAGATAVASGDSFDCALLASGKVVCWGDNGAGQLGDGTTTPSATPVLVLGLP
jgi:alpha-tubulin suppressor-like RCC1 family protein